MASAQPPDEVVAEVNTRRAAAGIGGRTVSGAAWTWMGHVAQIVLRVVVLAVLARLITPEDFGLIAAALVYVSFSVIIAEFGFGQALVQRADLGTDHIRVAFTTLMLTGVVLWALTALASPLVAGLFSMPELTPVLRVITIVFLVRNLTVGDFLLSRELQFRRIAAIEFGAYAVGYGGVAIALALLGWGVWAIVAGHVAQEVVRTLAIYAARPHAVRPLLARAPLRDLLTFGGGQVLSRIAELFAVQGDNFVVGRYLGPAALGLYGRAYQLMKLPALLFTQTLRRVLFPTMSAMQHDVARLRGAYTRATTGLALLALPSSVVAVLVSEELILLVLGRDWLPLREAFDILALGIFFPGEPRARRQRGHGGRRGLPVGDPEGRVRRVRGWRCPGRPAVGTHRRCRGRLDRARRQFPAVDAAQPPRAADVVATTGPNPRAGAVGLARRRPGLLDRRHRAASGRRAPGSDRGRSGGRGPRGSCGAEPQWPPGSHHCGAWPTSSGPSWATRTAGPPGTWAGCSAPTTAGRVRVANAGEASL
jgi:hypothetical protein